MLAVESGVDEILVKPFSLKDIYPKLYVAWKKFHNPKNPEKAYELAKQNLRERNWSEAEGIYQLLADSAKKSARPVVGLARVSIGKGDFPKALQHLADAEVRNASYVHIFSIRGEILAKMKKFDEALKCFEHAISLSPLNPVRYKAAADILMACQRFKDAVSLLEAAVKSGLEFKALFNHLSYAYFMMKDFPKALRYVKSALGLDPDNVTFLNQMGICLKNLNQMEEAARVYNQIIKLDPNNVAALYNKASLCEAKNEFAEAIKLLERAVKKDPSFAQATSKLEDLKRRTPPIAS
jgi:tetratricopeptide (TPR) repeat protein